jgi:hypothetical protein
LTDELIELLKRWTQLNPDQQSTALDSIRASVPMAERS